MDKRILLMALILALIVAIPTFLALIPPYLFSYIRWNNTKPCDNPKRNVNIVYRFARPVEDYEPDILQFDKRQTSVTIMRLDDDYQGIGIFMDNDWVLHVSESDDDVDQITVDNIYDANLSTTPHDMSACYGEDEEGPTRFAKFYRLEETLEGPVVGDCYDMKNNFDDVFTFYWDESGTVKTIDVFKNKAVADCKPEVEGLKCYYLKKNPFPDKKCVRKVPMLFAPLFGKHNQLLGFSHSIHCHYNTAWMEWAYIEQEQLECVKEYMIIFDLY